MKGRRPGVEVADVPASASSDAGAKPRRAKNRGPYVTVTAGARHGTSRPSEVLAENLRAYRLMRNMTQDELAARMAHLCHGWGRSTVSAVEGTSRNVTIDELFGLAVSVGVTIGQLLDPTGPDHTRRLSLDVGLREGDGDEAKPVAPRLAHLWAASRAVIRLWHDDGRKFQVEPAEELPTLF